MGHPRAGSAREWELHARPHRGIAAAEQPVLAVHRGEQLRVSGQALGGPEEQIAPRAKGIVEQRHELPLQLGREVDEHVPTRDQVERGEGRVLDQAVLGEGADLAELLRDLVRLSFTGEEALEPLRGDVLADVVGVAAAACGRQQVAVDVGGEDPDWTLGADARRVLAHQDGDGEGLLARGTARHPDTHGRAGILALEDGGDDLLREHREDVRVAKEVRHPDEQVAVQERDLRGVPFQVGEVVGGGGGLLDLHAPSDSPQQRAPLVLAEVVPGVPLQDVADRGEARGHLGVGGLVSPSSGPRQDRSVGLEARGHLFDWQREVHQPRRDRALGHALVPGGPGSLRESQAAVLLDRPQAGRTVGPGSREDDPDGVLAVISGERAEERVDGRAQAGVRRRCDPQYAPLQREDRVRRDDVDVVGLWAEPVLGLLHWHRSVLGEQLGERAGVAALEVLDDDHDHPGVGRHRLEEAVERFERTGGGSDPHDETVPWHLARPLACPRMPRFPTHWPPLGSLSRDRIYGVALPTRRARRPGGSLAFLAVFGMLHPASYPGPRCTSRTPFERRASRKCAPSRRFPRLTVRRP